MNAYEVNDYEYLRAIAFQGCGRTFFWHETARRGADTNMASAIWREAIVSRQLQGQARGRKNRERVRNKQARRVATSTRTPS